MKINVESKGLGRMINVVVPAADVNARLELAYEAAAKTAKLDGFREGMAPVSVIKTKMGDSVRKEVARQLIAAGLEQAVKDNNLNLAGQPHVHAGEGHDDHAEPMVTEGEDFHFHAHGETYPTIEPKAYEGLKLERETADMDDSVVTLALERLQQQLRTFKPKSGAAVTGDRITLSGQGYTMDGKTEKAFDGGKLDKFPVVIGSNMLIPGFEDGLVDSKKGDQLELELEFPKDYHAKDLAGKDCIFKLTIDDVEEGSNDELTDESVKPLGFDSLDKLKKVLWDGAERDLKAASDQRLKRQLLDKLDEVNMFDLPEALTNNEHAALWRAQLQELQMRRLPLEALGKSPQEAMAELRPLAERRVRLGLLMAEIARIHTVNVTAADLDKAVQDQVKMAGPQADQVERHFMKPENRSQLAGPVLEDKVTQWLYSKATITEKKIAAKDLLSELQ